MGDMAKRLRNMAGEYPAHEKASMAARMTDAADALDAAEDAIDYALTELLRIKAIAGGSRIDLTLTAALAKIRGK